MELQLRLFFKINGDREKNCMGNKIRVAMVTTDMPVNGISTVILNYCQYIDQKTFDITIISGTPVAEIYIESTKRIGISLLELPSRRKNVLEFYIALKKHLKSNNYDILHVHCNSATVSPELYIGYQCGIPVRIAHSHNTTCTHMAVHKVMCPVFKRLYTHGFACSSLAGKWLFGNNEFYVISNGFRTERFRFDAKSRDDIRHKLNIDGKFVIGHIGRFNDQKNHPFLLEVFEVIAQINPKAYLLLIGSGPNVDAVKRQINEHPYKDRIILYGVSEETEKLYDAMDVFVLPSKYEGLGIVLLEAQISGLPCVTSDVVPKDVELGGNVTFLPLSESKEYWANLILNCSSQYREDFYNRHKERIMQFDIEKNARDLEKLYKSLAD